MLQSCPKLVLLTVTTFTVVHAVSHAAQPASRDADTSPVVLIAVTDQTISDAPYYLEKPKQGDSPDGVFKAGTKLQRLSRIPSFSRVRSETGIEAFVPTRGLRPYEGKPASPKAFTFSGAKITHFQREASQAIRQSPEKPEVARQGAKQTETRRSESPPDGWTTTAMDPMKILGVCKALHVKRGYVLRGYVYVWGPNANGVVWALPIDGEFPPPDKSPQNNRRGTPPRPPAALENVMDAMEGDQSPWSYLCASILCRELQEFGAVWHGIRWGHHIVLGKDPFKVGIPATPGTPPRREALPSDKWTWSAARPTDWRPQVRLEQRRVIVTFYTYSGYAPEGICRHVDTYQLGSYRFDSSLTNIATGTGGYIY